MKYFIYLLITIFLFASASVHSKVKEIHIKERCIVADSFSFGNAGIYEKIRGEIIYEIDPANEHNSAIVDLRYAPKNSGGMVECRGDFLLLKPVDMKKSNGKLLYGVNNRGNLYILRNLNNALGSNNPIKREHFGDGFLMKQGYSVLWSGWNWDVINTSDFQQFEAPAATIKGEKIRQKITAEIVNSYDIEPQYSKSLAWGNSRCYPSLNFPDNSEDILTVRDSPEGKRRIIPNDKWQYASLKDNVIEPDPVSIYLEEGFLPGKIYELVYEAENPKVVGLGLAAVRDAISFFRFERKDDAGNKNPLLITDSGEIQQVINTCYIMGISQSGRFIAHMLWQGFHVDEKGRMVFDGARIHIAGGGKGGFNHRFARTTHHPSDLEGNYMPADHQPFNYLPDNAPGSGGENDILAAAKKMNKIPKIIITNHALEYWTRAASLLHTTTDGQKDAGINENVRLYIQNGAPHGTPWKRTNPVAEHGRSTLDTAPVLRSTLMLLDKWVTDGEKPPENRHPSFAGNTLITAGEHKNSMPDIPGMFHPGRNYHPAICDYGPDFWEKGIISNIPPVITDRYITFVPAVDKDGNGKGGIRLPEVSVPLGTYQGFNPRKKEAGGYGYLTRFSGSFWPFALTREERLKNNDPRLSIEERYRDKDEYISMVRKAANDLLEKKFLIPEDANSIIDFAEKLVWPPEQTETYPFWKLEKK